MKTKLWLCIATKAGLFAICIACISNCYSQNWLWAKSAIGTGWSRSHSVSTDANGNVFVAGSFSSPIIIFGSDTLINADSIGNHFDIFLAKYDVNGHVLWAKSAVGTSNDYGSSVNTDVSGNVFVTGDFQSPTITFDSTTLINVNPSGNYADAFIAKYDMNGNVLWVKSLTGPNDDCGMSVSADADGNVFVTGYFQSPTITFGSTTLTNSGSSSNVFLVKYDANGNVLWAKSAGGGNVECFSVSADAGGNVFITGGFSSPTMTFGSTTLTNAGSSNIFIAKYDANGNMLWAKSAGGTSFNYGNSISADAGGNVFITGGFHSPTITFGSTTLTNSGGGDEFITKYDSNGHVLWAKSAGGIRLDGGCSVSTDVGGNVFVTGFFYSPNITFGSTTLNPPVGSTYPMFIVKYDANGNVLCASALASGGYYQNGVSADPLGNAYIVGFFDVNPFIVGTDTLPLTGTQNVFVAKYSCNNNVAVNELSNEESVSVYPNPTSGVFVIASPPFGGINSAKQSHIEIYNLLGEKIFQSLIRNSQSLIDISDSPNGIYFVHIISENGSAVKKIIVQK